MAPDFFERLRARTRGDAGPADEADHGHADGDTGRHAHPHAHAHPHPDALRLPDAAATARDADAASPGGAPIAIVGAGHVGTALGIAFARAGWAVTAVASRDPARRARFVGLVPGARPFPDAAAVLDEAELVFLTVPDDAVAEVAARLRLYSGQALVHTSGLLAASVLAPAMAAGTRAASFHPLVAFADTDRAVADLQGATVALEGDELLLPMLSTLAQAIGAVPVRVPAEGKAAYHAAAVLSAGGTVALLDAIVALARGAGLDEPGALAIYLPLVRQALANAERIGVAAALTGPIVRGDVGTLRAHVSAIARLAPASLPLYLAAAEREVSIAEGRGDLTPVRAAAVRDALAKSP